MLLSPDMMSLSQTSSHGAPASSTDGGNAASAGNDSRAVPLRGNRFDSRDIFQATREIIIAHGEETYRLRLTAQNKLILTK
jgi:hemin uptake protein HemP|nr:hemin uptake protein HemP [Afipia sp. P52-10]